jgi:transposase
MTAQQVTALSAPCSAISVRTRLPCGWARCGEPRAYEFGPVTAVEIVVSFSHPGRCRSDAAFAALSGTWPLEASSGRTVRHRLNRGGDRALNSAIHTIAMVRLRSCATTQAYADRRAAEGKTGREIRRCLRRYIARALYRALTATMAGADHHHAVVWRR